MVDRVDTTSRKRLGQRLEVSVGLTSELVADQEENESDSTDGTSDGDGNSDGQSVVSSGISEQTGIFSDLNGDQLGVVQRSVPLISVTMIISEDGDDLRSSGTRVVDDELEPLLVQSVQVVSANNAGVGSVHSARVGALLAASKGVVAENTDRVVLDGEGDANVLATSINVGDRDEAQSDLHVVSTSQSLFGSSNDRGVVDGQDTNRGVDRE